MGPVYVSSMPTAELERPFLPAGGGGFAEGGISSDQGHDFRG